MQTTNNPGVIKVAKIIAQRDGMELDEAIEIVLDCRAELLAIVQADGEVNPYRTLEDTYELIESALGLEPDYLDDLIFNQI